MSVRPCQEAVLHPAHVTEGRRLDKDADAAALAIRGVERPGGGGARVVGVRVDSI